MATIKNHYGISGSVPFADVEIDADNRLFLDPHAIRLSSAPVPFVHEAIDCSDSFLREVTRCVISGSTADRQRGEAMLQRFVEPWETRLGMSAAGFSGHGGGADVGSWIWDTLTSDVEALVRVGILRQLEDLPLFVGGVDRDITSDITTRIVFGPLADFTASVVASYPEFTAGTHRVGDFRKQVWDPVAIEWAEATVSLPIANGKPLLLVPAKWARPTLLMSAGRFYETSVLSYEQLQQAAVTSDGKLLKTPKDLLKEQPGLERGRSTNLRITQKALDNEEDLLAEFKRFVAGRYDDDTAA